MIRSNNLYSSHFLLVTEFLYQGDQKTHWAKAHRNTLENTLSNNFTGDAEVFFMLHWFSIKKKKAEGAVHLLVIHCLLAPNPPSFLCFVILKLNSVNICPLPASTEGAENHRKRQGLLILVPGFCCLFSLLGMTWQCCVETDAHPLVCLAGTVTGSFRLTSPKGQHLGKFPDHLEGCSHPLWQGLNLRFAREGILQVCSFSGALPQPGGRSLYLLPPPLGFQSPLTA